MMAQQLEPLAFDEFLSNAASIFEQIERDGKDVLVEHDGTLFSVKMKQPKTKKRNRAITSQDSILHIIGLGASEGLTDTSTNKHRYLADAAGDLHLQTMALTYQEICQGEQPWVALGNFMNDWFDYAKDRRTQLVADPLTLPAFPNGDILRWAAFCTASVEWLCERYGVRCPSWVHTSTYCLPEPWFDAPHPNKPQVREWLIKHTPEPFTRRNIYCGNRMFANKYEFAEQYRRLSATMSSATPG